MDTIVTMDAMDTGYFGCYRVAIVSIETIASIIKIFKT